MPLDAGDEARYRPLVARANYLAPDRADIAFATEELGKSISRPSRGDWIRLRRLGRYLVGTPRMQVMFKWQWAPMQLFVTPTPIGPVTEMHGSPLREDAW